jgi:hypothetical protein
MQKNYYKMLLSNLLLVGACLELGLLEELEVLLESFDVDALVDVLAVEVLLGFIENIKNK